MFRAIVAAFALIGLLAAANPTLADALAATGDDHADAAAPATEQPETPPPAKASSPGAATPGNTGFGKDIIAVGFGWG